MISFLSGDIKRTLPNGVILNVQGVGYELSLTLPALASIDEKDVKEKSFWVFTKVREDSMNLYGFLTWEERMMFSILIQISGVGPRVAMAVLSTMNLSSIIDAIDHDEPEVFGMVPGIGKRTSEKILLELKAKREKIPNVTATQRERSSDSIMQNKLFHQKHPDGKPTMERSLKADLNSALSNLGFKEKDILNVISEIESEYKNESFSQLVKQALKMISSPVQKSKEYEKRQVHSKPSMNKEVDDFKRLF